MKTTADEKGIYSTRFSRKIFVKAGIVSGARCDSITLNPTEKTTMAKKKTVLAFEKIEDDYQNGLIDFLRWITDGGKLLTNGKKPRTLADVRHELEWILSDLDECEEAHGVKCKLAKLV